MAEGSREILCSVLFPFRLGTISATRIAPRPSAACAAYQPPLHTTSKQVNPQWTDEFSRIPRIWGRRQRFSLADCGENGELSSGQAPWSRSFTLPDSRAREKVLEKGLGARCGVLPRQSQRLRPRPILINPTKCSATLAVIIALNWTSPSRFAPRCPPRVFPIDVRRACTNCSCSAPSSSRAMIKS